MPHTVYTPSRRTFLSLAGAVSLVAGGSLLAGCSASAGQGARNPNSSGGASAGSGGGSAAGGNASPSTVSTGSSALIAVFSWSGNTLKMAQRIQELDPDAGFFRIETADPYPNDVDAVIDQAQDEQDRGYLPELTAQIDGWDSYDTVFLGYPIWWYELPQAVKSFIGQYDWSGKTIVPFNSHEGSGDSGTPDDIAELCIDATVAQNLAIRGGDVASSLDQVDD